MNKKGPTPKYGDEIVEFVRKHVKTHTDQEIAQMVSEKWNMVVTRPSIQNLKLRHGIRSGVRRGTFPKGHEPFNKGTKGLMNVGGNKTSFKKGDQPINYLPIGTERINRQGYVMVKVQDHGHYGQRWKLKSRIVWEQHHGRKLGPNDNIMFLDGDRQNLSIDNLKLIDDAEHAVMSKNRLHFKHADLTEIGLNLARIKIAVSKNKKKRSK